MGQIWSTWTQASYKVIYVQTSASQTFPIRWPKTWHELLWHLRKLFPTKEIKSLTFLDASHIHGDHREVTICSEQTFQGLVPKTFLLSDHIRVYYIVTYIH